MTDEAADTRVWAYSAEGEAELFEKSADVPSDWADSPAAFGRIETVDPLDHDGDGKKGGSKPKAKAE